MRSIAVMLLVLLASCGGADPIAHGSAGVSTEAEPSAADSSRPALPSVSSASAPSLHAMEAVALDDPRSSQAMGYLVYLPTTYAVDGEPSPLLVFLHGAGEAGDGSSEALALVDDLGIPQLIAAGKWSEELPFVVLAPQYGTAAADSDCSIGDDLARFLTWALLSYNVDPSRVYLTGVSCGAIGIWDYVASYGGERVAATVPIAGHAEWALEAVGCEPLAEVPVWAFHGALDEVVPPIHIEGPMEQIRSCAGPEPAEMELTVFPDADHLGSIDLAYDLASDHDIYAWLLGHTNDSAQ